MISYLDAVELIKAKVVQPSKIVGIDILDALGHVVVENVVCDCYVSPFDNSAMDGFAVKFANLEADMGHLPVIGSGFAGDVVTDGTANNIALWEIMTGAAIPHGFDTVIKIEDVEIVQADDAGRPMEVELKVDFSAIVIGQNVRKAGEDFKPDDVIVERGEQISSAHIAALASVGIDKIACYSKPEIAIMSTGREIIDDASLALKSGQIRNSNGPNLMALFTEIGINAKMRAQLQMKLKILKVV